MNSLVVYYSRGGRTRKIAEAIAQELGCEAVDIKNGAPQLSKVDLLLVGSGNYGAKPHSMIQSFIDGLQQGNLNAAVFTTSGGPNPKSIPVMQKALEAKGYRVASIFKCRGQFLFINWGRPNEEDLRNARAFAKNLKTIIK